MKETITVRSRDNHVNVFNYSLREHIHLSGFISQNPLRWFCLIVYFVLLSFSSLTYQKWIKYARETSSAGSDPLHTENPTFCSFELPTTCDITGIRTRNLLVMERTRYCCATQEPE